MTRSRATLVNVEDTPYYHCIGRCVRRAYLCGVDATTGASFEHRRAWICERLSLLADVFAVDLCAYALMSNHYHLVVKVNPTSVNGWSDQEVAERWTRLFKGPAIVRQFLQQGTMDRSERAQLDRCIQTWRERLADLSWFMRCLNETIARKANREDGCTGHFWESRFKSQALLDEPALLTAMVYVDLNPVRAGVADNVQDSDFTSVQARLREITDSSSDHDNQRPGLLPFLGGETKSRADRLPFNLQDYLELVDTTGRCVRPDKPHAIATHETRLLTRLGLEPGEWLATVADLQRRYQLAVGSPARLIKLAQRFNGIWMKGLGQARRLYVAHTE
jgi:REP element-mobilizing transposase RayT